MGLSFLFRARGPSRRARASYLSGSPSMVGRVSNEAVTAVGLFWRQPLPDTAMKDSPWYVYRDNKDGGARGTQ